jgi:hypothetical protein
MAASKRDTIMTIFAVLFALLAVSNLLKPLAVTSDTGFVLFGHRLTGSANAIAGPLFGLLLAVYAAGIWRMSKYALPMAWAYASYVLINLVLFNFYGPKPEGAGVGYALFGLVYAVVALGVSFGAAVALRQRVATLT